jgi:hypothetical protein
MQTFDRLAAELDRANLRYAQVENSENEIEFDRAADARLDVEDRLLDCRAESLEQLRRQVDVLKRRAAGGHDVTAAIARWRLPTLPE